MNWFDRAIAAVAPGWALQRSIARAQLGEVARLGAYRGATHERYDRDAPTYRGASADWTQEQAYDRRELVDRAQDLERKSILADAVLEASTLNVVGHGFRLQCQTDDVGWNAAVEERWREWGEHEADSRGIAPLDDLLALTYRSYLRDGDVGAVLQSDGQVRLVESDEISSRAGPFRPDAGVDGIDLDERGRVLRYHVNADARGGYVDRRLQGKQIDVDAKDMLFIARRQRLGQTRGISAFAGVSWILDQIDGQIEAVTVAARMAACFGLVLKRAARFPGTQTVVDSAAITRKKLRLEPGAMLEIDPGESVEQINPTHPAQAFPPMIQLLARLVGRPFGLPLEVILLDFSQSNYSSSRGALLQAHKTWGRDQGKLARFLEAIFAWRLAAWVREGEIPFREDWRAHVWLRPGWQWVDPQAEVQAGLAAIDAGLDTASAIAARGGQDFEELILQRERELAFARKHGVDLARSNVTRDVRPTADQSREGPETATSATA